LETALDTVTGRAAPDLASLGLSASRPLVLVDVDEVLGLFMQGFGDYAAAQGYEMRIDKFALFQNIYPVGSGQHITIEEGRTLFDAFFASHCDQIEPAPGAIAALNRLANHAGILILSNAPAPAQALRAQWLSTHGMDHPLILNSGPKGPIAAALTRQTTSRTAFVDDLIPNLDSVADHSPATATFQHVADLRPPPPDRRLGGTGRCARGGGAELSATALLQPTLSEQITRR
jgi:hypothetical protein